MKRKSKTIFLILVIVTIVLSLLSPIFALSDDFSANEDYWKNLCSSDKKNDNKSECSAFQDYLESKNEDRRAKKEKLAKDREEIQKDIIGSLSKISYYEKEIEKFIREVKELEKQIINTQFEVTKIEQEIKKHEKKIEELEEEIKKYMVNAQSTMRVNGYIEFIMGAKDFSDIVRRTEGLNAIKRYSENIIEQLRIEKEKLDESKIELENKINAIKADKVRIEESQKEAEVLKEQIQFIHDELVRQKVNMDLEDEQIAEEIKLDEKILDKIDSVPVNVIVTPPPRPPQTDGGSNGSVGNTWKTESVWEYSFGGTHLGTDYAGGIGTAIPAPGNGIVVVARGGCATEGSWGCNGGLGNYVTMVFNLNGHNYGTLMAHMQAGSIAVSPGTQVSAGQLLGRIGDSGSSMGSHVHIELFDLGPGTLSNAIDIFNKTKSGQFGLGGSTQGQWSRCDIKGSIPCRLNPENFFG